ncbi:MAG: type II toxin-antitoxin system RelE/ParE family toxin [Draconibacterium sp.]
MALKIFWTDSARFQLKEIFNYYRDVSGLRIAQMLKNKIFDRTWQLAKFPESGPLEPLLSSRKLDYRYLVEGNYKIIYLIDNQNIIIAAVFDCRQNPTKMQV